MLLEKDKTMIQLKNIFLILTIFMINIVSAQLSFTDHTVIENNDNHWPNNVSAIDFDKDGDIDLLSASPSQPYAYWFNNDGEENFSIDSIYTGDNGEFHLRPAYINADSILDIVAFSFGGNSISWYEHDGNKNFTKHAISDSAYWPLDVIPADLDDDGDTDIVATTYLGNDIFWLENNGSGEFTQHVVAEELLRPSHLAVVDIDNDLKLDILCSNGFGGVSVFKNDGEENFTKQNMDDPAIGAQEVHAIDLDGDDDLDILTTFTDDNRIAWYENIGDSIFNIRSVTELDTGVYSIYATDIDSDTDIDIVSASNTQNRISVHINDGNENFTKQVIINDVDAPIVVISVDVNGDNLIDILSISSDTGKLAWHEQKEAELINTKPYFVSVSSDTAHIDSLFSYTARAIDPEGSDISYTFQEYPMWLTPADSIISGTPQQGMKDTSFTVIASDGILSDTMKVEIKILEQVNTHPYFISVNSDTTHIDSLFSYTARAIDPEGSDISYTFQEYPMWLTPADSIISGTPQQGMKDTSFTVIASDGVLSDTLKVEIVIIDPNPTHVDNSEIAIPVSYSLYQNYPNPFNPQTKIAFDLPKATDVYLEVFNTAGQRITVLVNQQVAVGHHEVTFNSASLASGIYIYRLKAGDYNVTKRMILLK